MTEQAKAKLQIAKATDTQIDASEKLILSLAADFIHAKPWAKLTWDQATNARFLLWLLGLENPEGDIAAKLAESEFASMSDIDRAILALWIGNASQGRQRLEKAGHIAKAEELGDYK